MRRDVKQQMLNGEQLLLLSYQTCQWWNATFIQARRFFEVLDASHGGTPWDKDNGNSMFVAERMFFIAAIYHAIEDLQKLDIEMQRRTDYSLHSVIKAIEAVAPLEAIKNLRDMNEHGLDYLSGKGQKPKQYRSTVLKNNFKILTTAAWTHINGDAKTILLGNVEIDKLLFVMKDHLPFIREKTKEIYEQELLQKTLGEKI